MTTIENRQSHVDVELTVRGVEPERDLVTHVHERCRALDAGVHDVACLCTIELHPLRRPGGQQWFEAHARVVGLHTFAQAGAKEREPQKAIDDALDRLVASLHDGG